ncbi:poly-gamma-glutamate hydrolase family protein [Priestia aryabhattai]|uniref:poly-gamma-glutamate hydrolase family protein n=1 Tax=Priestia aryabhattai TaxID=412384 RepID=UPI00203E58E8|nr:poly-gamma-glutamate hydrolase family protein [Priestia aryabhattai]MCM3639691.1 poly-gamma-glutamate hydrolase family protein [Priestia aryabhattai]
MADKYASMTELEANTTEGVDYNIIAVENPDEDIIALAIHGGSIEAGSTELATLISEKAGYSLFSFEAIRPSNNTELHVTSTHYDEPTAVRMVSNNRISISVHGASGTDQLVNVGGLDFALRNAIWEELTKKGINAVIPPESIIGQEPDNIANRTTSGKAVQLEITTAMRKAFFVNGDWSSSKRKDRANWTQLIYDFADAVVTAVEKSREHYETDSETTYIMDFNGELDFGQGTRSNEKEITKKETTEEVVSNYQLDSVKAWVFPDKTTINGAFIETGSVTTQQLNVGVGNPNIVKVGYDSFEGMVVGEYAGTGEFSHATSVTDLEISTAHPLDGNKSMRIKSSADNDGYVLLAKTSADYNIVLDAGKYYILSVYAYSPNNGKSNVQASIRLDSGEIFKTQAVDINKDSGWTRLQVKFKSDTATQGIAVLYNNTANLSAWFDCLQIEQVDEHVTEAGAFRPASQTVIDGGNIVTGSLSFDKAKGGTITLGGENNENGKLAVYNSQGELIADLDGDAGGFSSLNVGNLTAPNVVSYAGYGTTNIYVSDRLLDYTGATAPDDSNAGDGWIRPLATIEEALRRIPRHIDGTYNIILASGGKYYEDIRIQGYGGGGTITIDGQSRNTIIQGYIATNSNNITVRYQNFTMNTTASYSGIYYTWSHGYLENIVLNGIQNNGTSMGLDVNHGGAVQMNNCEFYSCVSCVASRYNGSIYMTNCKGYGSSSGLQANGGTINGSGTAPTGASAKSISNGGRISDELTANSGNYVVPAPPETTKVWDATSADSWRDNFGGQWYGQNEVVQGYWGGYGKYRGLWFFGSSPSDTVKGKTIKRIRLYVERESKGGNSGGVTVYFKPHTYTSKPSGVPSLSSTSTTSSFKWGDDKWVTIPSSFYAGFQDGTYKGIGIYINSTNSNYYAKFLSSAKLEITYG